MPYPTTIIELEGLTLSELVELREQIQSQLFTKLALDADTACDPDTLKNLLRMIDLKSNHAHQR